MRLRRYSLIWTVLLLFILWMYTKYLFQVTEEESDPDSAEAEESYHDDSHYQNSSEAEESYHDDSHYQNSSVIVNDSVAMDTLSKVKIFCWITTREEEIFDKMAAVNETWARRCDNRMFVMTTTKKYPTKEIVDLHIKDGRKYLTEKTIASLKYIYKHHLNNYDWFLKADDDTFVVMENLKFLLSHYNATEGIYVGHLFKKYSSWGYMSGGAGYVLSREAVRLLVEKGYNVDNMCQKSGMDEDVEIALCLHNVGIAVHNTLDRFGRESFHAFGVVDHIIGSLPKNIQEWDRYKTKTGKECCSQLTISFHYVDPRQMRTLEFLLYRMSVYGRKTEPSYFKNFFQIGVVPSLPPQLTWLGCRKLLKIFTKNIAWLRYCRDN